MLNAVIGAFGYTGKYITERLVAAGEAVVNLTGHLDRPNLFGEQVSVAPLDFARPEVLARSLEGAEVLYNTYWVRFARGAVTFDTAVENSRNLLRAAEDAGVRRIVHISITNASPDSRLPYFRGKGLVEEAVKASGMSHAIIRPTVVFGPEDILVNNIAWFLRRFPVFPVFGSGRYAVQPVFVEDLAEIAVDAAQASGDVEMDAVGPETLTFNEMLSLIGDSIGSRTLFTHLPPALAYGLSGLVGYVVRDVVITRDEIEGLMAGLLVSTGRPTADTRLSEWLSLNAETIGARYASELRQHYR